METIVDKFIIQLEEQLAERRIAITLLPSRGAISRRRATIQSTAPARSRA